MQDYVTINGKKFRKGYTTGACAAAASKAAVKMLAAGGAVDEISIDTPAGVRLTLPVSDAGFTGDCAGCSVVKDGGDDPDITTGLRIFASARYVPEDGIHVKTEEGIGRVTLPGLKVPVGQPAVNPVPMKMILKEVEEVLPQGRGVEITLSVPGGAEVAKKTYNPRLGIEGGISILGTTGIVNPMSEEAWKESLALELSVLKAKGKRTLIFTFGNYGEDFIENKLGLNPEDSIKISNFVGYMLDRAVEHEMEKILLTGHMGKLVKVAAGIFHTHSRIADGRMETLTAYAALEGASKEVTEKIYGCRTTEAAVEIIKQHCLHRVFDRIASNAARRCREYTFDRIRFGTVLFHSDNTLLSMGGDAEEIIEDLRRKHGQ